MLLATWAFGTSRQLFQIGILLAGIGSGVLGLAALRGLAQRGAPDRRGLAASAVLVASLLLLAGFVLMILSVHFGTSPFRRG